VDTAQSDRAIFFKIFTFQPNNFLDQHIDKLRYINKNKNIDIKLQLNALNNATRLKNLEWLKAPDANFPPHHESGLNFNNGVCVAFIQDKAGISLSITSQCLSSQPKSGNGLTTSAMRENRPIHAGTGWDDDPLRRKK
jgi:hypothetical protein